MDKSKYLDVFIEEARENLQVVNNVLLELEERGFNEAQMNEAFRVVHTIKGTASVIGIESITELSHVMEDLFDVLRKRGETPERALMELLFNGADMIEKMLDDLEKDGTTNINVKDLTKKMKIFRDSAVNEPVKAAPNLQSSKLILSADQKAQIKEMAGEGKRAISIIITFVPQVQLKEGRAYQLVRGLSSTGVVVACLPAVSDIKDSDTGMQLLLASASTDEEIVKICQGTTGIETARASTYNEDAPKAEVAEEVKVECAESDPAKGEKSMSTGSTIRVKAKLLDQLLDLVGEIMINNIRINQIANDLKQRELKQTLQNNARLMGELQDIVLRTRMVQVDFIFKRFPRMVRDISADNGKDVEFTMKGNDIEIDRSLLDEIGDALVHLLRNAIDHGIEPVEKRVAAGKKAQGSVILSAYQEQSNIVITVEDDGRGMDPEKIMAKAISKGLVTQEEADRLDEKSKLQFVFLPGFSTAEKLTDISGRGVGLDVVKTKIEGLGGFVRLDTQVGKGSKITLKLPPSMSIIRAMLVEVNKEKYAIPLENVRETVRVPLSSIHVIGNNGVLRLREEVIPILNIHTAFGGAEMDKTKEMPAIIVEKNDNRACLIVTRLIGQQEIVVKNLGKDLRSAGYFSGATILGDGKVAMILDVGAFI